MLVYVSSVRRDQANTENCLVDYKNSLSKWGEEGSTYHNLRALMPSGIDHPELNETA